MRNGKQKDLNISNFTLLLAVFKWQHGSERIKWWSLMRGHLYRNTIGGWGGGGRGSNQTPSTGLQHPSSMHYHKWLHHSSPKTVGKLTVFRWCSNSSKFVTDNSNWIRHFFYNCQHCLGHHKWNQSHFNQDGIPPPTHPFFWFFSWGGHSSCLCACFNATLLSESY